VSEVTAIGKLKRTYAALVASLDNLLGYFGILVIEHRHHTGSSHLGEHGDFIKFCHCLDNFSPAKQRDIATDIG